MNSPVAKPAEEEEEGRVFAAPSGAIRAAGLDSEVHFSRRPDNALAFASEDASPAPNSLADVDQQTTKYPNNTKNGVA